MKKNTFFSDDYLDGYIWGCVAGIFIAWVFFMMLISVRLIW